MSGNGSQPSQPDSRAERIRNSLLWEWTENKERWTVRDAVEGIQVFGATGSGKTSGSGAAIASALLRKGRNIVQRPSGEFTDPTILDFAFGGLVLTAKPEEFATWAHPDTGYLARAGRRDDLVEIAPNRSGYFNFLSYEFNRPQEEGGQLTHNIVALLLSALASDGATVSREDPFWNEALRELLTHAVDLLVMASPRTAAGYTHIGLDKLFEIVRSAPQTPSEAVSQNWRTGGSLCARLLVDAERRRGDYSATGGRLLDLDETQRYWLLDFPRLSDRTRSVVVSSFTAKVAGLLRSPMRQLFCSEQADTESWLPDSSFHGKVIVVNIPVMTYGEVGRMAQLLYKAAWQRAVARRQLRGDAWCPVFLWADESQYFVTREDPLFQQTARSQFCSTVYLTQNIPNYHAALDSHGGSAVTESLLGNLQTKIFHANGDPVTNEWAQRTMGQYRTRHLTRSTGNDAPSSPALEALVLASRFASLPKGGPSKRVGSYVFQAGRSWRTLASMPDPSMLHYHEFLQP